jgi:hypothetical protein
MDDIKSKVPEILSAVGFDALPVENEKLITAHFRNMLFALDNYTELHREYAECLWNEIRNTPHFIARRVDRNGNVNYYLYQVHQRKDDDLVYSVLSFSSPEDFKIIAYRWHNENRWKARYETILPNKIEKWFSDVKEAGCT